MTDKLVRRLHPSTPQRIASTTQRTIVGPAPMAVEVPPAMVNRFQCFVGRRPHAPQTTQHLPHVTHIQTGQGRFNPLQRVQRVAVLGFGYLVEVLGTMVIVEHLACLGKQGLNMFPDPLRPIPNHTQPHAGFRNQVCLFDLLQGLSQVAFRLHLMPAQDMHDTLAVEQVETKPLGFAPLVAPACPSRPMARLPRAAPTRASISSRDGATSTTLRPSATWWVNVCMRSLLTVMPLS